MGLTFTDPGHRYRLDGRPVPNVTTILNGGIPKGALVNWAARTVAEAAADMPSTVDALRTMGRGPLVAALAAVPDEARNRAAARGTDIHHYAEDVVHGRPVEVPPELADAVQGYVLFLDASGLKPLFTERPCASRRYWYAGRFDLIGEIRGETWLLDVKTSRGVYGDTSCQLAAYACADFMAGDDGEEYALPDIDRIGVLHVQPHGTDLYEMGEIEDAFTEFRAAQVIYKGASRRRKLGETPVILTDTRALF